MTDHPNIFNDWQTWAVVIVLLFCVVRLLSGLRSFFVRSKHGGVCHCGYPTCPSTKSPCPSTQTEPTSHNASCCTNASCCANPVASQPICPSTHSDSAPHSVPCCATTATSFTTATSLTDDQVAAELATAREKRPCCSASQKKSAE